MCFFTFIRQAKPVAKLPIFRCGATRIQIYVEQDYPDGQQSLYKGGRFDPKMELQMEFLPK